MKKIFTFLFAALMSVSMYATTVTWDNNDITGSGNSFTKDGVTITAGAINFNQKNFEGGGTFTTTLGNFTKIEVTTGYFGASGTGWSGSRQSGTWTGNASSVSFSGDITGMSMGNTKFVFTIEDSAPQPVVNLKAIEFQVPASWENDTTYITAEDFPGFVATTYDIAKTLSVPSDILIVFVYDFPGNDESSLFMKYGGEVIEESTTAKYARGAFFNIAQSVHIYYPVLDEPAPTTYTLKLVADPEKGSVAVSNLLGSDIIDNHDGTYTVPANAEVTILATANEGYEFTGWKVGNRYCDFTECGTALNTLDNPLTITMTEDVAYKAEFKAKGEGIENIVLTEKAHKVVVDGMLYIVRDGKLFNLQGAQVR